MLHRAGPRGRSGLLSSCLLVIGALAGMAGVAAVAGADVTEEHPRLMVTVDSIDELQDKALAPGNPFFAQLQNYLINPPSNTGWTSNATEAQRQGMWRAPSVALHYALTGNGSSFNKAKGYMDAFLAQEHWEVGGEEDSGMGAGNIMIGAAIAYDFLYDDLSPSDRETFRNKLLLQAERMYNNGHVGGAGGYWQADPQNNHRWHRDAGLTLAALAVADPDRTDDDWILARVREELDYVAQWLPPDGSNHEGPSYAAFGQSHLALAMSAADRVLGTDYMQHDFWKNTANFRLATVTPGFEQTFAYGDSSVGGYGAYNNYALLAAATHAQADQHAALMQMYEREPGSMEFGWMSVLWHDPSLDGAGSIENLPKSFVFEDIGFGSVRDGWDVNDVALSLKSGPYGGQTLNHYRNANGGKWVNIAHDDPDANSFLIYARGQMLARPDGYSNNKQTGSHNTILVNGEGQRGRNGVWSQPIAGDMNELASITWHETRGNMTIIEGEAGGAYDPLSRYRRTMVFQEGEYILVLDDIRSSSSAARNITWLIQGSDIAEVDGEQGKYAMMSGGVVMPFSITGNVAMDGTIGISPADHRGSSLGLDQLQLTGTTDQWRSAAVFDAWGLDGIEIDFIEVSDLVTDLYVTGPGFEHRWRWDSTGGQTVLNMTVVPEPASIMPMAVLALLARRPRRRTA